MRSRVMVGRKGLSRGGKGMLLVPETIAELHDANNDFPAAVDSTSWLCCPSYVATTKDLSSAHR